MLVNRYGIRPCMIGGGVLAALGLILGSSATNIIQLYLTTGVITGLGLAMNFQPALIMLNKYFNKKRPLANGLAAAGSPVALCCLSPLNQVLLYKYGWRGSFYILSGLLLNCCVCGALMRPLKSPKPKLNDVEELAEPETKVKKKRAKLLDFSVCRSRGFIIYTVSASILVFGLFVPPVFIVNYAKSLQYSDTESALLLTILGFVDIFARPTCGVIAGLPWVRPRCVYFFSFAMILNGATDIIGSLAYNYLTIVCYCIAFGISYGMVGALQFEVLMAMVGSKKFSSAIGLVLLVEAMAVLVGPPGAGRLLDATQTYAYVFILAGSEVSLAAVVLATSYFLFIGKSVTKEKLQSMQQNIQQSNIEMEVSSQRKESGDESDNKSMTTASEGESDDIEYNKMVLELF